MAQTRMRDRGLSAIALQRMAFGLFFVVLGLTGIIPQAGEGLFGLSRNHTTLEVVFGIIELACGLFLLVDSFRPISRKTSVAVLVLILIVWLARVVLVRFIQGIDFRSNGILFRPAFWSWLLAFATDLVIASGLWTLYRAE
ncbi:MAG: hypothetical protein E4H20_07170 [Spirochaetales bacterium]|nr:MAG: hypothetical protein E4H20_07170 [Spirochaetales bacterium]